MNGVPPEAKYLFLGNYVDHSHGSLETICLCLAYKIVYPENFFMLRGSHECAIMNRMYVFFDECTRRYDSEIWNHFISMMNCMPIGGRIMCMSGGLSPELVSPTQIYRIRRPADVSSISYKFI